MMYYTFHYGKKEIVVPHTKYDNFYHMITDGLAFLGFTPTADKWFREWKRTGKIQLWDCDGNIYYATQIGTHIYVK